jgi:hypothetical protein
MPSRIVSESLMYADDAPRNQPSSMASRSSRTPRTRAAKRHDLTDFARFGLSIKIAEGYVFRGVRTRRHSPSSSAVEPSRIHSLAPGASNSIATPSRRTRSAPDTPRRRLTAGRPTRRCATSPAGAPWTAWPTRLAIAVCAPCRPTHHSGLGTPPMRQRQEALEVQSKRRAGSPRMARQLSRTAYSCVP